MEKYHLQNRPNREIIDQEEIRRLLKNGKYAVLSLCRENEPYIITLSYGYEENSNSLYFHCAKDGLKIDFIKTNPHVCATIMEDGGYIRNECGHWYKSLVFWGTISILSDFEEKKEGMKVILNHLEKNTEVINKKLNSTVALYEQMIVLKLEITEIHGKSGR